MVTLWTPLPGDLSDSHPQCFPCERSLPVGAPSVFASDVFYCPACYDYAEALTPALGNIALHSRLGRGITCGGGRAQD